MTKYWWNKPRIRVLTICRSKTDCQFRIHGFLEAACFNFITLQDPRRLLYVHCKSSSSTPEHAQNTGYLSKIFLVCFIMAKKWPKYFWPESGHWFISLWPKSGQNISGLKAAIGLFHYGRKVAKIFLAWKWPNTDLHSERLCNNFRITC